MSPLAPAHQGYEYQDLLVACRLVDVMLDSVQTIYVDQKLTCPHDTFDDLTTLSEHNGLRERVQIKHTRRVGQTLTLSTFTTTSRRLRLDHVVSTALADRNESDNRTRHSRFRIVLRDAPPTDPKLLEILGYADPDPGPFVPGINTARMAFSAEALWEGSGPGTTSDPSTSLSTLIRGSQNPISYCDLVWVCERLIVEVGAPAASFDLADPGEAERLLLRRVREEVGSGTYPNQHRADADVARCLVSCARAARSGSLKVTKSALLRGAELRVDYGAVARRDPVDRAVEVERPSTVAQVVRRATSAANAGRILVLLGPPGQGKSWICKQVVDELYRLNWVVAEHYCYLAPNDQDLRSRVQVTSVFGSLLSRLSEYDPEILDGQRPRFAANERALEDAVLAATKTSENSHAALVIDGIDHAARVLGQGAIDPSLVLAEALAALNLPVGSVLVILSQPGPHLQPLEDAGALAVDLPKLTDPELEQLAINLGVIGEETADFCPPDTGPRPDAVASRTDLLSSLSERSAGNALYATYLCREASRNPVALANPSAALRSLPPYKGSLRAYYEHIRRSLGDQGGWVADVLALTGFPLSRADLKQIRPDGAHHVDQAVEDLRPVLMERATQVGIRIYHESFARFLQETFSTGETAKIELLRKIARWLEGRGLFDDIRSFRYLLSTLAHAGCHESVVNLVDQQFVLNAVAHGFPASATIENLARAIHSAAATANWPAIVRYVEMSRSVETYQEERFETAMVGFADVAGALLGAETLADRLLHEGRTTMSARLGLQMCAALDAMGAIPPWREYMRAFLRERKDDRIMYGEAADQAVHAAWLRGRLRLASSAREPGSPPDPAENPSGTGRDEPRSGVSDAFDWNLVSKLLQHGYLSPSDVVEAVLDTFGYGAAVELMNSFPRPGACCVALAEAIQAGSVNDADASARDWAEGAVTSGLPRGYLSRVLALGVGVQTASAETTENDRERLLALTRSVQRRLFDRDVGELREWLDRCAVAARRDVFGLASAEALLKSPGWYTCWLRFSVALAFAEAKPPDARSFASLEALRILTEVDDPFAGEPRACDLFPIHGPILATIRRALSLLDNQGWEEALGILGSVSDAMATTVSGELGGPLPKDSLLQIAVETARPAGWAAARDLLSYELDHGGGGRYYADLAEYRLIAARLALKAGERTEAWRYWSEACELLTAYGWHKDMTVFELLDPLPLLVEGDRARGRAAVARSQLLCERVALHTDGRETHHARDQWWRIFAAADPAACSQLLLAGLLGSCNDPNHLLHEARLDLWRTWHGQADPVVAAALRLTLDEPLDGDDPAAFESLVNAVGRAGDQQPYELLVALLARVDERPFAYGYANDEDLLSRSRALVDALNTIAARADLPAIGPSPAPAAATETSGGSRRKGGGRWQVRAVDQTPTVFEPGAHGLAKAIRTWQQRRHTATDSGRSVQRFSNILGYRLCELLENGQERQAEAYLRLIADSVGLDDRPGLLRALGQGLERLGHVRLATASLTLAWTRRRGSGGWSAFGGATEIESLRHAARLNRAITLTTLASEVERLVSQGLGTVGVTKALVTAFSRISLSASSSTAFEMWEEALAVIAARAPRVAPSDDPSNVYSAQDGRGEADALGDLDSALAASAIAGLAHPGREQKRRSFLATQTLIDFRPSTVAGAISSALSLTSDPATLTWLLRVIELAGDAATPILAASQGALRELARGPLLTARTLARRLLSDEEVPIATPDEPDSELLERNGLLLATVNGNTDDDLAAIAGIVDDVAGVRLSRAESMIPGLGQAVERRVRERRKNRQQQIRLDAQLQAYSEPSRRRWPNAFLVPEEIVEDALQRAAAGARAARLMNGEPVVDPAQLEEKLAEAILDDPSVPLALERTRQPRPDLQPPPLRGDALWQKLLARTDGRHADTGSVQESGGSDDEICGTVTISDPDAVPTLQGGRYSGWRLIAVVERRSVRRPDWKENRDDVAERFSVVELRRDDDQQALTLPPVAGGGLRAWRLSHRSGLPEPGAPQTRPIVGYDPMVKAAEDGHAGLGIHLHLLTPTRWMIRALRLEGGGPFLLHDSAGGALALITWRTEYETSDYDLAWPRLVGAGLVVRGDAFGSLIEAAGGILTLRDFLSGPPSLAA